MTSHPKSRRASLPTLPSFLLCLASALALGALPTACQSGGVGDPCTPEDEHDPTFAGFDLSEENIESRSFQCDTRICLVNHFQGRVSCPLGQPPPRFCGLPGDAPCLEGESCVLSASRPPDCEPGSEDGTCRRRVCQVPGACQRADATEAENENKACCVPGTDTPTTEPVCGQCAADSARATAGAVYCSCRCGPPEGQPPDENFDYCSCPSGFECAEIRKDFGLGDPQLRGKYCIKQGSAFEGAGECGGVKGHFDPTQCAGVAAASSP